MAETSLISTPMFTGSFELVYPSCTNSYRQDTVYPQASRSTGTALRAFCPPPTRSTLLRDLIRKPLPCCIQCRHKLRGSLSFGAEVTCPYETHSVVDVVDCDFLSLSSIRLCACQGNIAHKHTIFSCFLQSVGAN